VRSNSSNVGSGDTEGEADEAGTAEADEGEEDACQDEVAGDGEKEVDGEEEVCGDALGRLGMTGAVYGNLAGGTTGGDGREGAAVEDSLCERLTLTARAVPVKLDAASAGRYPEDGSCAGRDGYGKDDREEGGEEVGELENGDSRLAVAAAGVGMAVLLDGRVERDGKK